MKRASLPSKRQPSERGRPRFHKKKALPNQEGAGGSAKPLRVLIGNCIQQHRLQARLTQKDLAEKCDLSLKYVGEIERGEANIRTDTLDRLVRAVGWNIARTLGQGPQTLNDGIRRLLLSHLATLDKQVKGLMDWLDALQPDQPLLNVADADVPVLNFLSPPANPPSTIRRGRTRKNG